MDRCLNLFIIDTASENLAIKIFRWKTSVRLSTLLLILPSGKNSQNWHFVVIRNKEKLHQIAEIIEKKMQNSLSSSKMKKTKVFYQIFSFCDFFKNAPVVILVYAGPYMPTGLDVLEEIGAPKEEIEDLCRPNPGIQSVGAAIENSCGSICPRIWRLLDDKSELCRQRNFRFYRISKKRGYYYVAMVPSEFLKEKSKPSQERYRRGHDHHRTNRVHINKGA